MAKWQHVVTNAVYEDAGPEPELRVGWEHNGIVQNRRRLRQRGFGGHVVWVEENNLWRMNEDDELPDSTIEQSKMLTYAEQLNALPSMYPWLQKMSYNIGRAVEYICYTVDGLHDSELTLDYLSAAHGMIGDEIARLARPNKEEA